MLSAYLFPIHSFSCQLAVPRALVDGVKEKAIEVKKSCPKWVEHLQAGRELVLCVEWLVP